MPSYSRCGQNVCALVALAAALTVVALTLGGG